MEKDEYLKKIKEKTSPHNSRENNVEHFKYEVAQEVGISHRKNKKVDTAFKQEK